MRAGTLKPAGVSIGPVLLGGGAALLALALSFLAIDGGRDRSSTFAPATVETSEISSNETIAFWEARVSSDPLDFTALNRLAGLYLARARETGDVEDYTRAQAAVDASLASLPGDNYTAYAVQGALHNVRHEFTAAAASALTAISLDPPDVYALAVLGDAQLALGQYDEAFFTYNQIVDRAPSLSTFSRLAHMYELRGQLDEAEGAWNNAFSTGGGSPEAVAWARVQFGNFYFSQGDLSGAGTQYAAALDAIPGYVHGLAAQARLDAANGDYDRAIALYEQVAERQPLPEYVAALGDTYAAAGRSDEAQEQYELIEAIDELYRSNGINTDLQHALFLADHDLDANGAVREALAVYETQPGSIYAADAVAWTLYKAGRFDEAVPYVERALRLGTRDSSLLFHAGMIHAALGDEAPARDYLSTALELNPYFSLINAPLAEKTLEGLGR